MHEKTAYANSMLDLLKNIIILFTKPHYANMRGRGFFCFREMESTLFIKNGELINVSRHLQVKVDSILTNYNTTFFLNNNYLQTYFERHFDEEA